MTDEEREAFLTKIEGQMDILSRDVWLQLSGYAQAETDPVIFEQNLDMILKKIERNRFLNKIDELREAFVGLENKTTARILLNKLLETALHLNTCALAPQIGMIGNAFQHARILILPDRDLEKELTGKVDQLASQASQEKDTLLEARIYTAFLQDPVHFGRERKACPVLDAHMLEKLAHILPQVPEGPALQEIKTQLKTLAQTGKPAKTDFKKK